LGLLLVGKLDQVTREAQRERLLVGTGPAGVIVDSVPNPTLSGFEEFGARIS